MQVHPTRQATLHLQRWLCTLVLMLLAASPALAEEPSVMMLEGTTVAPYDNGNFTVFDPTRAWDRAKREEWLKTHPDERPPLEALGALAQVPIGPDGTFRLEVAVDKPRRGRFAIFDAVTSDGKRLGAVSMANNFILEPGELKLRMIGSDYSIISGGYYNDAVINSWLLSDNYQDAQQEKTRLRTHQEDEPEEARRRRLDRLVEVHAEVRELERKGFENVALTHPDLMVRRVAIDSAWIFGPSILDPLRKLAALTPEDPWAAEKLARMEAWFVETSKIKVPQVGETILDFTGETLAGEKVRMADLRGDSRYLLVEFWASWCGPCRVEIPHMKQAYARFRDQGFEIVSFTVDDEREDWEEASAEEDLPWTDIGMGFETEAARTYNVRNSGVPSNYLVESRTGKIVAKDLRQHKLDEKLEELLN